MFHLLLLEEFINRISLFGYINNGDRVQILITGATSGIGYEVSKELIKRGHHLYLGAHTEKQVQMVREKLKREGLKASCLKIDVTNAKDLQKVEHLNIDCLINHAGIGIGGSIVDTDISALEEVYAVNIFGNFQLLQKVYQHMKKRNIRGKIFVTSSLAGMLPFPYLGFYTSSKAAISMLVFTMHKELSVLAPSISISLIEPGAYHTGFNQVMIDHRGKTIFEQEFDREASSKRLQRNLFALIEKKSMHSIVQKIVKEVEKDQPRFKIRAPFFQVFFTKLYLLLFR